MMILFNYMLFFLFRFRVSDRGFTPKQRIKVKNIWTRKAQK